MKIYCTQCETENTADADKCRQCGHSLTSRRTPATNKPDSRSNRRQTVTLELSRPVTYELIRQGFWFAAGWFLFVLALAVVAGLVFLLVLLGLLLMR